MLKNLTVKFFGLEKLRNIILRFFKAGEHKSKEQKVLGFPEVWEAKEQKVLACGKVRCKKFLF